MQVHARLNNCDYVHSYQLVYTRTLGNIKRMFQLPFSAWTNGARNLKHINFTIDLRLQYKHAHAQKKHAYALTNLQRENSA